MKKAVIIISAVTLLAAGYSFAAFWNNAKKDVQRHTTDVKASAKAARRAEKRGKGLKEGYEQYKAIQQPRQLDPVTRKEEPGTSAREQWKMREKTQRRMKKSGSF